MDVASVLRFSFYQYSSCSTIHPLCSKSVIPLVLELDSRVVPQIVIQQTNTKSFKIILVKLLYQYVCFVILVLSLVCLVIVYFTNYYIVGFITALTMWVLLNLLSILSFMLRYNTLRLGAILFLIQIVRIFSRL